MTYVKHNKNVKDKGDLQNLVTGTILQQMNKSFTQDHIEKTVNRRLKGSKFHDDLPLIREYVTNTLTVLKSHDVFQCCNSTYSKRIFP